MQRHLADGCYRDHRKVGDTLSMYGPNVDRYYFSVKINYGQVKLLINILSDNILCIANYITNHTHIYD